MNDIADPRTYPDSPDTDAGVVFRLAAASLAAETGHAAQAHDRELDARIDAALGASDVGEAGRRLAAWLSGAPSVAIYRHLWRALVRRAAAPSGEGLAVTLFAIPLAVVAGVGGGSDARATVPGVLSDAASVTALLIEHGALGGNRSLAVASALVAADAIDAAALPRLLAAQRDVLGGAGPLDLVPAPLALAAGESVHLRFIVGTAVAAAGVDVLRDGTTGRWGMPLTQALSADLGAPGLSLLAIPRPAASPLAAVVHGRTAQRDVSAQLFASNAIRTLRSSVGEPSAVISAHRAADAPGGGELRLSLSSPFSPRDAHGFRCPILPHERADDVASMLVALLRDARVADVRIVAGVHDDRDPLTGGPLMFKPETIPAGATVALH